jgi:SAM-dependent methyltransferase
MNEKIEAFNIAAVTYDDWYKHPQGIQIFEAEKKALNIMIPEMGLGLEIGSGTGAFAKSLENDNRIIICIDPSRGMTDRAKQRGLICILGVGDSLPLRKGIINFIYMVTVIEFIPNPLSIFRDAKEVARGSPLFILFINKESNWGDLYTEIGRKGDPVFKHAKLYTLEDIDHLLKKSNYKITISIGTLNSNPQDQIIDSELLTPSAKSGVILVKAEKDSPR